MIVCIDGGSPMVPFPALQCVAACCSVLQCVAVCCSVLQLQCEWGGSRRALPAAPHSSPCGCVSHCVAVCCGALQCVAVRCSVLRCGAACCSVLQRVAVCCSARFSPTRHVMNWIVWNLWLHIDFYKHDTKLQDTATHGWVWGWWCAYGSVISHTWMGHVTHIDESCPYLQQEQICIYTYVYTYVYI